MIDSLSMKLGVGRVHSGGPLLADGHMQHSKPNLLDNIGSFAAELANTVRAGEEAAVAGVTGALPVQTVVERVLEAERSLTTAISIRDKVVSSYLELTRMQI